MMSFGDRGGRYGDGSAAPFDDPARALGATPEQRSRYGTAGHSRDKGAPKIRGSWQRGSRRLASGSIAASRSTDSTSATQKLLLAVLAVINLASSSQVILWVRSIHLMKNHDFFVTQIVFPVTVNLISWPIVAVLACTGRLTAEERATPRWKFAALALMAGTFNLANAFPQSVLPGSLMTVLFTTHTPILMLMSRVLLGTRYRWPHFVSAALIIGAAAIITLPKLRTAAVSGTDLLWIVVYVALLFNPNDIYTEKWLKDVNMSTWYFRANVGVFELLLGLLLVPTMLVHIPGHTHVPADQLWSHLQESWRCFWGSPIAAGPGNMTLALGAGPTQPCADSLEVWQVWGVFIALYPFSIITTLMLTKYGSAVLSSVVSALSVPVTVAFYQWPALAGVVAQHGLGWNTAVAMVVAAIGVALYTTANERSKQRQLSLMDEVARSLSRGPPGEAARYRALHDGAGGDDAGDDRLSVEVGPSGTR